MASAMLFAGVLAVITAIMGGQKRALEAQRRMEAALIAEERMGQAASMPYADLFLINPLEPVGPFFALTTKLVVDEDLPGLGVRVRGTRVRVFVTHSATLLAEAELFIPEPQS